MLPSSACADMATLPKVDTNCTAPSLIPTVNGNTVRSFSTHGQQSAAKGRSTTVSRSDIRLIRYLDFSALWSDGPEVALNWRFPYPLITHQRWNHSHARLSVRQNTTRIRPPASVWRGVWGWADLDCDGQAATQPRGLRGAPPAGACAQLKPRLNFKGPIEIPLNFKGPIETPDVRRCGGRRRRARRGVRALRGSHPGSQGQGSGRLGACHMMLTAAVSIAVVSLLACPSCFRSSALPRGSQRRVSLSLWVA
jgi:hypothetical protein